MFLPSTERDLSECNKKRCSQLELYRIMAEQQNIGLLIGRRSTFRPMNSVMEVFIELYGQKLFLPQKKENWQVEFQPGTEQSRHFELTRIQLSDGRVLIIVVDITSNILQGETTRNLLKEARHNATHDQLTTLANRAYLLKYAKQTFLEVRRELNRAAVFVLDIDKFKSINDTLGHDAGDAALHWVAERLQQICRDSDFIARLGGDEFCVIQRNVKTLADVTCLAEKLVEGLCDTISSMQREISISSSIGVALFPNDGTEIKTLLQHADKALYESKKAGRNCFRMYSKQLNKQVVENAAIVTNLYTAFTNREFQLRYQPVYTIDGKEIQGVEAFTRWLPSTLSWSRCLLNEGEETGIRCGKFLHLIERMKLSSNLFKWGVETACRDLAQWRELPGCSKFTLSLNCSLRQLEECDVLAVIEKNMETYKLERNAILLEISEEIFSNQHPKIQKTLKRLRHSNINLVLDGFTCSKNTPLLLRQWQPDKVKINMNCVCGEEKVSYQKQLITDLVTIARFLSSAPICAGQVESTEQLSTLKQSGCAVAQGYFFNKSMHAEKITDLLHRECCS